MARAPRAGRDHGTPPEGSGPRWIDYVSLEEIPEAARNPKRHDKRGIRASVEAFGYVEPIVRDERTGRLVAGHGRLEQLRALEQREADKRRPKVPDGIRVAGDGRWLVPVVRGWASVDDAAAEAYLVASNRLTERGGWDDTGLAEVLAAVQDADPALLALTGFDDAALAGLLESIAASSGAGPGTGDPDALPVITADPVSQPGDVWQLGPHRLAVGDATHPELLAALMGNDRATCLFTDPPYGVDYVGKTAAALRIAGDDDGAPQLFADALEIARPHLAPGSAFYVCYPGGTGLALPFLQVMTTAPWRYRQGLVWCKTAFILGHSDYHFAHEDIAAGELVGVAVELTDPTSQNPTSDEGAEPDTEVFDSIGYGHLEGPARGRGRRAGGWYGSHAESTVLHYPKPAANPDHPTPKPVPLVARLIGNSTRRGQLVLDMFAGSGALLAACHITGRIARMVELEPRYADGICRRWQHLSGSPPVLERTGTAVPFPPADLVEAAS
jgi:hypothetical protein